MSERIGTGEPRTGRTRINPVDPWAWMRLRRTDMHLPHGLVLGYMPIVSRTIKGRLTQPPADLEIACYWINRNIDQTVEVLRYGHSDNHPHLDTYVSVPGVLLDAGVLVEIIKAIYGTRGGIGMDIEHHAQGTEDEIVRATLYYCAAKDPLVRRLVAQDDGGHYH